MIAFPDFLAALLVAFCLNVCVRDYPLSKCSIPCSQVAMGLVVALDYKNPFLNIYEEFQVLFFGHSYVLINKHEHCFYTITESSIMNTVAARNSRHIQQ